MDNDQKTRDRLKESEATKHDHDDTCTECDGTRSHCTLDERFNLLSSYYFTIA